MEKKLKEIERAMEDIIIAETAGSVVANLSPIPGVAEGVEIAELLVLVGKFRPVLVNGFQPLFESLGQDIESWASDTGEEIEDKEVARAAVSSTEKEIAASVAKDIEKAVTRDAIKAIVKSVTGDLVHWIPIIGWIIGAVTGPVLFHHMAKDLASRMRAPYAQAIDKFRQGITYLAVAHAKKNNSCGCFGRGDF